MSVISHLVTRAVHDQPSRTKGPYLWGPGDGGSHERTGGGAYKYTLFDSCLLRKARFCVPTPLADVAVAFPDGIQPQDGSRCLSTPS